MGTRPQETTPNKQLDTSDSTGNHYIANDKQVWTLWETLGQVKGRAGPLARNCRSLPLLHSFCAFIQFHSRVQAKRGKFEATSETTTILFGRRSGGAQQLT